MPDSTAELIPTRTTLIHRLKDWQDQSSWQRFFDTYSKLIYGIALKGGLTETEAKDVVQETMISVAKQMPTFKYDRKVGSFKSWLLNTTRWRIMDQLRNRKNLVAYPETAEDTAVTNRPVKTIVDCTSPELDALWDAEWEKNLLDTAISKIKRRLDPQKYQMFDLNMNKQWSAEKVAETFKVPVAQVYLAKHRVTEMIKEEVERLRTEMV